MPKKKYFSEEEKKAAAKAAAKRYRAKNPDKMKLIYKRNNEKNRTKKLEYNKEYNKKYYASETGKRKLKEAQKKWLSNKNDPKVIEYKKRQKLARKKYQKTPKGRFQQKKQRTQYRKTEAGRLAMRRSSRKNFRKRYANDPTFKLIVTVRRRLVGYLKKSGSTKPGRTLELVGCSKQELRNHIEKQFYDNPRTGEPMTWKNYGTEKRGGSEKWHVDHIKPFDAIDKKSIKAIYQVMNYKNLRPLWAKENIKKSDNIIMIESDPRFTQVVFKKTYASSSKLKELDDDIKKMLKKKDPDLEIGFSVYKKRNGTFEAIVLTPKLN